MCLDVQRAGNNRREENYLFQYLLKKVSAFKRGKPVQSISIVLFFFMKHYLEKPEEVCLSRK